MAGFTCSIVPPYLLEALADAPDSEPHVREMAIATLARTKQYHQERHKCSLQGPGASRTYPQDSDDSQHAHQSIVPDYVLQQIVDDEDVDEETRTSAKDTLVVSGQFRRSRAAAAAAAADESETQLSALGGAVSVPHPTFNQEIYDMKHSEQATQLPGTLLRKEGDAQVQDVAANEVYNNTLLVLKFFSEVFGYTSVDGNGHKATSSVHYGDGYGNAHWQGNVRVGSSLRTVNQMIYGDGDGTTLGNFTKALDVIGHEFTHGITQFNSHLVYQDESGALNEHLSDVFGILVKQKFENKTADAADWLIGEACYIPAKKGVALRSMKRPGKAFDDDRQIDHYSEVQNTFKKYPVLKEDPEKVPEADHGGVHYFSGIPNKAFFLVAEKFGGFAWEKAGKIWWNASITKRGSIPPNCTFIQFANVTVESAKEMYGADAATIVRNAWNDVGVTMSH